jgi:hypothetical protein
MPRVIITTEIDLSIETGAKWFAGLDDDQQCRFLVEVARIAVGWPDGADHQWHALGGHLRSCECSTKDAREMIKSWAYFMENSTHT